MTNQHQATPYEWAQQEDWANRSGSSDSSCIIELRDRVEALEATQQPQQDKLDRLIALDRDDSTEAAAQQPPLFTAEEVARIKAKAAEAGAQCAVEQIRSKPAAWRPLKVATETVYGDAKAAAKQILRAPMVVEGTFEHGGETYRFKAKPEREIAMDEAQPAGSLVERVADAIAAQATSAGIVNDRPARAAILEVAAWLKEEGYSTLQAEALAQEANRTTNQEDHE
jgi:hypothetical protein